MTVSSTPRYNTNIGKLIFCAKRFAALLSVPPLSDDVFRQVIEEVLYEKGALESTAVGIITKPEAIQLLLAHLHTALGQPVVDAKNAMPWEDEDLVSCVRQAMFGA